MKQSKPYENSGKALRARREEVKMTQIAVAKACGVHVQFVSNWERGICYPPRHCHKDLAKALKLGKKDVDNDIRERIWQGITTDFNQLIDRDFGWLT